MPSPPPTYEDCRAGSGHNAQVEGLSSIVQALFADSLTSAIIEPIEVGTIGERRDISRSSCTPLQMPSGIRNLAAENGILIDGEFRRQTARSDLFPAGCLTPPGEHHEWEELFLSGVDCVMDRFDRLELRGFGPSLPVPDILMQSSAMAEEVKPARSRFHWFISNWRLSISSCTLLRGLVTSKCPSACAVSLR
jgi:hypothetical protein